MKLLIVAAVFIVALVVFLNIEPSADKNWQPQYKTLPQVSVDADQINIKNMRDFRYSDNSDISARHYIDKQYALSELETAWLGLSHFGGHGLAHAFISFGFSNGEYLVVSLEARLAKEDSSYNPITGLFRHYNKMIVLGTEQDIIGLRTHIRGEKVFLYQLNTSPLRIYSLLLNYFRVVQDLNQLPEFYNSVFDNCLTGLLSETRAYRNFYQWLDYRVLLPGYADEIAHKIGLFKGQGDLNTVREQALVNPAGFSIESQNFSNLLRK